MRITITRVGLKRNVRAVFDTGEAMAIKTYAERNRKKPELLHKQIIMTELLNTLEHDDYSIKVRYLGHKAVDAFKDRKRQIEEPPYDVNNL